MPNKTFMQMKVNHKRVFTQVSEASPERSFAGLTIIRSFAEGKRVNSTSNVPR